MLLSQLLVGDGRCHGCREFAPEFDRAVSFGEYAGGERVWAATVARTLKEAAMPVSVERSKEEESEAAEMAVSV